jgi:hypothetical protein
VDEPVTRISTPLTLSAPPYEYIDLRSEKVAGDVFTSKQRGHVIGSDVSKLPQSESTTHGTGTHLHQIFKVSRCSSKKSLLYMTCQYPPLSDRLSHHRFLEDGLCILTSRAGHKHDNIATIRMFQNYQPTHSPETTNLPIRHKLPTTRRVSVNTLFRKSSICVDGP